MTAYPWEEVKRVFAAVVEGPLEEQCRIVERLCPDPDIRREVEALIASHNASPSGFLESPAMNVPPPALDLVPQQRIGDYRLIEQIGHGGMGTVYLASRDDDQFQKLVAIKLIRGGVTSQFLLHRFSTERQILSMLEHPSIARLLDAGTTVDGLPYLVMEHVAGEPIDAYCTRRSLDLRGRLELLVGICDAVDHAHRKLIVHRDLKPANVLITSDDVPKLLDFGIAKLLDDDAARGAPTATEARVMTPRYASPEQLRGEVVSVASDIYSLGVLAYELLTGGHPFACDSGPHAMMRATLEHDATPPSSCRSATVDPRTLTALRGDIDNILLKALRRQPEARYPSAADLRDDIVRYLQGRPVLARKPTAAYMAAKFVRRNVYGVSAAAAVTLMLIASTVFSARQAVIANRERARAVVQEAIARERYRDVRALSQTFFFELVEAIEPLPGSLQIRELVAQRALQHLDKLRQQAGDDPEMMADLAAAYERVGTGTQGVEEKEKLRRLTVEINERLVVRYPGNVRYRMQLASSLAWLGNVLKLKGDRAGELDSYRRAAAIAGDLFATNPDDRRVLQLREDTLRDFGRTLASLGRFDEAIAVQTRALVLSRAVAARIPRDEFARRQVVLALNALGTTLIQADRWNEALPIYLEALPLANALFAEYPLNNHHRRDVWLVQRSLGRIRSRRGEHEAALEHLKIALTLKEALYQGDPTDRGHHRGLAITHFNIGEALERSGAFDEALAAYKRAIDLGDALLLIDPSVEETYVDLKEEYGAIRSLVRRMNRPAMMEALRQREVTLYQRVLQRQPTEERARQGLARALSMDPVRG